MTVTPTQNDVPWYEPLIAAQLDKYPGASPDARLVARAIMVAGAWITDWLNELDDSVIELLAGLVPAVQDVAKQCDEVGHAVAGCGANVASAIGDIPS
jgi:hypothetical protein